MKENMTDKQIEIILNLVADKFDGCKDMDDVQRPLKRSGKWQKRKAYRIGFWRSKGGRACHRSPAIK